MHLCDFKHVSSLIELTKDYSARTILFPTWTGPKDNRKKCDYNFHANRANLRQAHVESTEDSTEHGFHELPGDVAFSKAELALKASQP